MRPGTALSARLGLDDELAPSYLHLTDQPTGRKARISLGREPVEAERIRAVTRVIFNG